MGVPQPAKHQAQLVASDKSEQCRGRERVGLDPDLMASAIWRKTPRLVFNDKEDDSFEHKLPSEPRSEPVADGEVSWIAS